jgi:hypothetical protein
MARAFLLFPGLERNSQGWIRTRKKTVHLPIL